jgi:ParB family chromosome partitioning protein
MKRRVPSLSQYLDIPVNQIVPSALNPRKIFETEYITELAKSLQRDGQWDPIVVRKRDHATYELIAGECRLKAAKVAGLKTLKAKILEVDDNEALLLALKTNLVRHNLNPVEEANALKELLTVTKDINQVMRNLSKSRTWALNRIKLAQYASDSIKTTVVRGELSLLSAIKIAELKEGLQGVVASKVIRERLNNTEVEKLVLLFKKATNEDEIEFLLQTPVKDYVRAKPNYGKGQPISRSKKKPTLMRCDCGALYIVDWGGCRIVSEKVANHEFRDFVENNSEVFK